MGIDLGHHQRDIVVVAEMGGVIHHHTTGGAGLGGVLGGDTASGGKQTDLHLGEVEGGQVLYGNVLAVKLNLGTGRAAAGQRKEFIHRELTLLQDGDHGFTDGTGSPYHRHIVFLGHRSFRS